MVRNGKTVSQSGFASHFAPQTSTSCCWVLEFLQEFDQRLLVLGAQRPKPSDDLPRLAAVGLRESAVIRRADDSRWRRTIIHIIANAPAWRDRTPCARNAGRLLV